MSGEVAGVSLSEWMPSRAVIEDSILLAGIATALVTIHYLLPASVHAGLAFDHQQPQLWNLLSAAYVHHSDAHLIGNVLGVLVAGSLAASLCRLSGERRLFYLLVAPLLVVLPVLVSGTGYVVFTFVSPAGGPTVRGFSGVVAAFVGIAFVALFSLVGRWYTVGTAWRIGISTFIGLEALVGFIYSGRLRLDIIGLVVLGIVVLCFDVVRHGQWPSTRDGWRDWGVHTAFVGMVIFLIGLFIIGLFPADVQTGGTTVNILGHGLGMLYGIGFGLVGQFLAGGWDRIELSSLL